MGMPEVLDVIGVPGLRCFSTWSKMSRLMSSRSTTTSMIQSQSAMRAMSSSKLPVVIRLAKAFRYKGLGLDLMQALR